MKNGVSSSISRQSRLTPQPDSGCSTMPVYTLIPDEHDFEPEEIEAADAAQLLTSIHGFGWNRARVLRDGTFAFTVSMNPQGFWSILPGLPEGHEISAARV